MMEIANVSSGCAQRNRECKEAQILSSKYIQILSEVRKINTSA